MSALIFIIVGALFVGFTLASSRAPPGQPDTFSIPEPHPTPQKLEHLTGTGRFATAAVGESYYLRGWQLALGPRTPRGHDRTEVIVGLRRHPTNPHDANAVALYIQGQHVGHLSRLDAIAYKQLIEGIERNGAHAKCNGIVRGGWDDGDGDTGDFGLWLDLPVLPEVEAVRSMQLVDGVITRLQELKSKEARQRLLAETLPQVPDPNQKMRLMLEASRRDVELVREHVRSLKTRSAKVRHLQDAIQRLQADCVPDELQEAEISALKTMLVELGANP